MRTCAHLSLILQAARRAEEERREAARRDALARAEAEQAERARWLQARSRHKETQLEARSRELAELRALHQRQRQMRAAYARQALKGCACRVGMPAFISGWTSSNAWRG